MRIIYLDHYAGSRNYGMEYRPYYLAREWINVGHSVTIVAAGYSHLRNKQPLVKNRPKIEIIDKIRYVWLPTHRYIGNRIRRLLNIADFLTGIILLPSILYNEKFDVIIASSTYPFDNFFAHVFAKKWHAIHIYEVHDLWPLSPIELGGFSKHNPVIIFTQFAEDRAYHNADLIVSLLPLAKQYMLSRGLLEKKFHYIPNGISFDESFKQSEDFSMFWKNRISSLKEKKILIGYAGSHGISNALEFLIEAARSLPEFGFVLLGKGPEKLKLIKMVKRMCLKNVLFFDSVPKKMVSDFLKNMDILYIGSQSTPLYRYGISMNKLMDYMLAGKPIVCAIEAGNDIVSEAGCGITIEPENAKSIVRAIRAIESMSSSQRIEMGLKGRNYVKDHHDFHLLAMYFLSVMQEALNEKIQNQRHPVTPNA